MLHSLHTGRGASRASRGSTIARPLSSSAHIAVETDSRCSSQIYHTKPSAQSASITRSSAARLQNDPPSNSDSGGEDDQASSYGIPRDILDQEEDSADASGSEQTVFLSLTMQGHRLGAASYNVESGKMVLLEDAVAGGPHLEHEQEYLLEHVHSLESKPTRTDMGHENRRKADLIQLLMEQINPDTVLASSKCSEVVLETIKAHLTSVGGVTFQIRPAREYNFQAGKARLSASAGAHITGSHGDQLKRDRLLHTLTLVDLDQAPLSTSCAAALIYNLSRISSIATDEADADNAANIREHSYSSVNITSLETLHLDECMTITSESRQALAIMVGHCQKRSANRAQQDSTMTVYSLLNHLRTPISQTLLQKWFLFPSTNLEVLSARHRAVECFSSPGNTAMVDALVHHLKGIKNIPLLISALHRGGTHLSLWKGLFSFCAKALHVCSCLTEIEDAEEVPIVVQILQYFDTVQLQSVIGTLDATIDWDHSAAERRFVVKGQVDAQLDKWRQLYAGLPSLLSDVANRLKSELNFEHSGQMNVAYFPQLGYLIALPFDRDHTAPEDMNVPADWTFHFASEISTYWKSPHTEDLNNHFGDIQSFIADREVELIHDVAVSIAQQGVTLIRIAEICAELDVLLSFAQAATTYNWTRPTMTTDERLDITGGRHALQELCVGNFQPNDTLLHGGCGIGVTYNNEDAAASSHRSIEILTGANGCGKSVYLKQVALIIFLAQIGSFVPAQSATIGVVDQILTRVYSHESTSKVQSSFMTDLGQVSHALRNCTARSLLILDEFGKGTLADNGTALFVGTIRYLLELGKACPRTLATTHFHEAFWPQCLASELPIKISHLAVLLNELHLGEDRSSTPTSLASPLSSPSVKVIGDRKRQRCTEHVRGRLTFLYRVMPGQAKQSHAAICARLCGVPEDVVARAQYVSRLAEENELERLHLEALLVDDETVSDEKGRLTAQEARSLQVEMTRFLQWDVQADMHAWQEKGSGAEGSENEPKKAGEGEVMAKLMSILRGD